MKKKKPFSQFIVGYVMFLVTAFIVFCCYEMHRLDDLSPIAVMGGGIIALLTAVVGTYMWRARQTDLFTLEMEKIKEKAKLRKKYGEYFEDETMEDTYSEDGFEG